MHKPELLLPAGNIESFFAAMDAGADAVYLGLKKFNARHRARNFSNNDIFNIIESAHKLGKKVYITLNTLIKNDELNELIESLNFISQTNVDAVIIQDFAIIQLVNNYFSNIRLHSSTQMVSHNELAASFFKKHNFERIIIAREISLSEIEKISKNSVLPIETFVHGSLCYSVSGQCLFSSYLGGKSANRGLCTQVCRRSFNTELGDHAIFSLKDFQLIDYIPYFSEYKISSLKIEGRLKNPEYIYNTARAYRMAIDDHSRIPEAKDILSYDFAREKTDWFVGNNIEASTTKYSGTGMFLGNIKTVGSNFIIFTCQEELKIRYQIRIRKNKDTESILIKIANITKEQDDYKIICETNGISVNDEVYLTARNSYKSRDRFEHYKKYPYQRLSINKIDSIKNSFIRHTDFNRRRQLIIRLSNANNLKLESLKQFSKIILNLSYNKLEKFLSQEIETSLKTKIYIELPRFIVSEKINYVKEIITCLCEKGFRNFSISHISQIELIPAHCNIMSNENIYLLNDLSISFIKDQEIKEYCYPYENDYPNMINGKYRDGILTVFFHPELFYSRMPVKTQKFIRDSKGNKYKESSHNEFSVVTDTSIVSFTQNINKFESKGFHKFMIDFSYENNFSKIEMILNAIKTSSNIENTKSFNIKKELD